MERGQVTHTVRKPAQSTLHHLSASAIKTTDSKHTKGLQSHMVTSEKQKLVTLLNKIKAKGPETKNGN